MSNIKFPALCQDCGHVTLFDTEDEQERARDGELRCPCGGPLCACESCLDDLSRLRLPGPALASSYRELRDTLRIIEAESTDDDAREWASRALEEFGGLA